MYACKFNKQLLRCVLQRVSCNIINSMLQGVPRAVLELGRRLSQRLGGDCKQVPPLYPLPSCPSQCMQICQQLDLGLEWFDAINAYVKMRIAELVKVWRFIDQGHGRVQLRGHRHAYQG